VAAETEAAVLGELVLGRGEKNECESEREGTRVILGIYMDIEKRRGSGRG
jgi:hypothetical protein